MIDVSDERRFVSALAILQRYRVSAGGNRYKGRFVQIFLALKFYQSEIPSIYSGTFIRSEILQSFLDDVYSKASRPLNNCVLSIFENNYLARTGIVPPGRTYSSNIWRNNLNLQKGIGCYAPPEELSSPTFLEQPRGECRHLVGELDGGQCNLCPSGATYRGENHRKWLRISSDGHGYACVDLMNEDNFAPYLAPDGVKIPIYPLIVALYHDATSGLILDARNSVSLDNFCQDFNFSQSELVTYFDTNIDRGLNADFVVENPGLREELLVADDPLEDGNARLTQPQPGSQTATRRVTATTLLPTPVLGGTAAPPPKGHYGWEAEQFVRVALENEGWDVHDVTRQKSGFDLLAKKGIKTIYVEVKSSVNKCAPMLTAREWQRANLHGDRFILSIIENFSPDGENMIYWIPNPARECSASETSSISYSIARSEWTPKTKPLSDL